MDRLRSFRNREFDDSIASAVGGNLAFLTKRSNALGRVVGAWDAAVPEELRRACAPVSLTRGILTVTADSRAAGYALDRWWRANGTAALAQHGAPGVRKIKVQQG